MPISKIGNHYRIVSGLKSFHRVFLSFSALLIASDALAQSSSSTSEPVTLLIKTPDGIWRVENLSAGYLTMIVRNGVTGEVVAELPLTSCPEDVRERGACLPAVSAELETISDPAPPDDTNQSNTIIVVGVAASSFELGQDAYTIAAEVILDACGDAVAFADCLTAVGSESWVSFFMNADPEGGSYTVTPLNPSGGIAEGGLPPSGYFIPDSALEEMGGVFRFFE